MKYLLLITTFFFALICNAGEYSALKSIEGAISNVIHCVFQDSKGYIWVGTDAGVSCYNGYEFKHLTRDNGLTDQEVFQIHEDNKGRLWFLTYNGEPTIYDNGEILTSKNCRFLADVKPGGMSQGFHEHGDSILYTALKRAYLFINDSLYRVYRTDEYGHNAHSHFMEVASISKPLTLYLSDKMYEIGSKKLTSYGTNENIIQHFLKSVHVNNNIVYAHISGINTWDISTATMKEFKWPGNEILNRIFYNRSDSSYWVLSSKSLYKYFPGNDSIEKVLSYNIPYMIYSCVDKQGNIWLSSLYKGLFFSQLSEVHSFDIHTQLNTKSTYCLKEFKGDIYAGLINGEYFKWSKGNGIMKRGPGAQRISEVYDFATINDELYCISGANSFNVNKPGDYAKPVLKALTANEKNAYIALSTVVVKKDVQKNTSLKTYLLNYSNRLYEKRANSIMIKGDDSVYIGGINGLKLIVNDKIVDIDNWDNDVFNTNVTKVTSNSKGEVLFSSSALGLCVLSGDKYYIIDKKGGLATNTCNNLFVVNDSVIWAATNKGVSKIIYQIKDKEIHTKIRQYSMANGLLSNVVNDVLVHKDTVWLATDNGVCFFEEDKISIPLAPPDFVIENFRVNNRQVNIDSELNFKFDENNIDIEYVGLFYNLQNNIQYRYKLEGIDDVWKYTNARRIEYPNLPPGHYKFLVNASNSTDSWRQQDKQISFTIHPPLWKTKWFVLLSSTLVVLVLIIVIRGRIRSIKRKHNLEQEALQLQKEKALFEKELSQLEQKALNLQMNPHFIFNAINAIKGFYAESDKDTAEQYIDKFATLMRVILEKSTVETLPLKEEIFIIKTYLELAAARYDNKFSFDITVSDEINISQIHLPPMLLQPIVENAVVHGMGPLQKGGKIKVSFEIENGMLVCSVEDNGLGIEKMRQKSKYKIHRSKGIEITQKRLLHISSDSSITFTDIINEKNEIKGTRVVFSLPVINSKNDTVYNS